MAMPATKAFCAIDFQTYNPSTIMRLPPSIQVYGIHDLRKKNKKEKDTSCVICVGGVRGKTQSQFNTLPMVQEEMKYILYSLQIEHETAKNLKQRNISIAKEFFLVL